MLSLAEMASVFQPNRELSHPLLVGFEYEVMLFERGALRPARYEGERGLGAVLRRGAELLGGTLVSGDPPNKVTLDDGGQLSLEPGGQFEFSSAPAASFGGCLDQIERFERLLQRVCDDFGMQVFYGGANPVHTVDEIGLVIPNERYRLMNDYFPRVGTMGRKMMRQTCSLQVTFDYRSRELGQELLRTALFVAPLAAALFCNAPYIDGAKSELRTVRSLIWRHTDAARSGTLPGFSDPDYDFERYAAHVVEAPMFFVNFEGQLVEARGMTFAQFNREGFRDRPAVIDDFELHNSTIFTDARLKRTVELRTIDGQDPKMVPAALAFASGLLMCSGARQRALEVLVAIGEDEHRGLDLEVARRGLSAEVAGRPVRELAAEMIEVARRGLLNCFDDGELAVASLEPLVQLVDEGVTPADVVLRRFSDPAAWLSAGRTW